MGHARNGAGQNGATETARPKRRRPKRRKAKTAHGQNGANPKLDSDRVINRVINHESDHCISSDQPDYDRSTLVVDQKSLGRTLILRIIIQILQ